MVRILVETKVERRIIKSYKGQIFFADDFIDLGNSETINKALHRLKEKGTIIRLAQGIYVYPGKDLQIGLLMPTIEEVAQAIAKRDRARIIPTGTYALNKLGLSTQIPLNAVFLTDGAARNVRINKHNIKFKKTTPKNLLLKGEISALVIQALRQIQKENLQPKDLEIIKSQLKKEKTEYIKHDAKLAPAWIREKMLSFLVNKNE